MYSLNLPSVPPGFSQVLGATVPSPSGCDGPWEAAPTPRVPLVRLCRLPGAVKSRTQQCGRAQG